jgi:putative FmdB family regulatory protein
MTYEYICTNQNCKHSWEQEQSITSEAVKICPLCKQETAKRLVSGGLGFQLKGDGWFKDLYSSSTKE